MNKIILNEKLTLVFEPLGKKVRLIITEANEELVCRKETIKNLQYFLTHDDATIFKGRLRLHKHDDVIEILVKDKPIGIISSNNFKEALGTI